MFDFAWSEIALVGVVALVLIGPKDMPIALKAITGMVKKARRMAAEFQTHVDDMVRDADLTEVRDQFRQIRSLDIRGTIARAVDSDGSIRNALKDPMRDPPPVVTTPVDTLPEHSIAAPEPEPATYEYPTPSEPAITALPYSNAPAFIPPADAVPPVPAPAFIPPEAAKHGAAKPHSFGV
ncbi:Sec-independent protein translocase protein TatB [Acidisphaera sp. L21]|jgi:sec-independent protein translocase protein TatB|uniref:Sec-independent protein translocase protein TatB n=1 Tax=Acidisphaera sp. L21 TaxID=1641851 RepID=UPI00131C347C|nr:Sec-independent protein translocase protein TatB [Acidisphaera sp. L21]